MILEERNSESDRHGFFRKQRKQVRTCSFLLHFNTCLCLFLNLGGKGDPTGKYPTSRIDEG